MKDEKNELMVKRDGSLPERFTEEDYEQLLEMSEGDEIWLKVREGGIFDGETLFAEKIYARILSHHVYWISFEEGLEPKIIPYTSTEIEPIGFSLKMDLSLILPSGERGKLILPRTSAKAFAKYVRRCVAAKLSLPEIVTEISVKMVANKKGQRFALAQFAPIIGEGKPAEPGPEAEPLYHPDPKKVVRQPVRNDEDEWEPIPF